METIAKLDEVINNLSDNKTEKILAEEQTIINDIALVNECLGVIDNGEDEIIHYDFSNIISLLDGTEYKIENINRIINDIKNVFIVKKNVGYNISLDKSQVNDFENILTNLTKLRTKREERLKELQTVKKNQNENKLSEIKALKDILEGKGRRRYYTKGMVDVFLSEIDIKNMDPNDALEVLEGFFGTRNMATEGNTYTPKQVEPEDFDEIVALFKSYVPEYFEKSQSDDGEDIMDEFEKNLIRRKNDIIYEIDLDNTREVLNWLRERGLLRKFDRRALLELSLYGEVNMLEKAYEGLKLNNSYLGDKAYTGKYATFWINYSGDTRKFHRIRGYNLHSKKDANTSRKAYLPKVSGEELIDNIKLVEQLIREGLLDPTKSSDNEIIIFKPNWRLEKNVKLARVFNIGKKDESYLTSVYLYGKDTERAINAAIELGLLHSPMDEESIRLDFSIPRNQEFQDNEVKKERDNTTIRDYFTRHPSKLVGLSDDMIKYLSYIAETEGYVELYKYFFSDNVSGAADWNGIRDMREKVHASSMNSKLCSLSDFPEAIKEYDKMDEEVAEYEFSRDNSKDYINPKILDNELITELEANYRVEDEIDLYDSSISKPNNYLYKIGDRLISRKKVLHIASILFEIYGYLDRDMILYSVTKDSYFNEDNFNNIVETIKKEGKVK